ncbi:MAG TPA: AI-2E family transporter [Pyrinomonadaceae bacterium]|jgi:predicted PurR-regulated permease PerM
MTDEKENRQVSSIDEPNEAEQTPQLVALASTSPSFRSIIRVVVIVLVLLAVKDFVSSILSSLIYLFFMVVLAVFLAYLINPLVKLIQRPFENRSIGKVMPRSLAIAISYLLVFTVLGVTISYIAPQIIDQGKEFATNVPTYTTYVQNGIGDLNRRLDRMRVSQNVQTQINDKITESLTSLGEYVSSLLGVVAIEIITYAPWLVLVPILSFFFLKDVTMFRVGVLRIIPVGVWRTRVESIMHDVNKTLAAYARAQLISCLLIGFVCTVGFYLLGNNYALLIGIIAGVLEFIPLIGPLTVAIIAVSVAGLESGWQALWTAIFLIVLRITHDYVTYPRIVREGIHLHPLAIILSVLAGEQVAGIPGVFIAIPLVALLTVLYKHVLEHSGSRGLFAGLLEPKENSEENAEVIP